jgi:hypothetical protein
MWTKEILQLLSNHRRVEQPFMPQALSMTQILNLLRANLSPNLSSENLSEQVQNALQELHAEGEILFASGNRYCMSPPTLLAASRENLVGLKFCGDRAFLTLAHQVLQTKQSPQKIQLHPRIGQFKWVRSRLEKVGICLVTSEDLVQNLPKPQKPELYTLQGCQRIVEESDLQNWIEQGEVKQYIPSWQEQKQRWQPFSKASLKSTALLRLSKDAYLWFENDTFYDIDSNAAVLAMFHLDEICSYPLPILCLGDAMNRLDLQGIQLPSVHAQRVWRLSQPIDGKSRIRFVPSGNRSFVEAVFRSLGCELR